MAWNSGRRSWSGHPAASAEMAARLALGVNRDVTRIVRVRTGGGDPLTLETAYLQYAGGVSHGRGARARLDL